ncbi:MAG TPA: protein phosphatase 2C domain-containing protein [Streptosporangiaceae bacterium]|nr:protein phosphatase 2C domain-containing protein [Streptosporangiaceae bacterium]
MTFALRYAVRSDVGLLREGNEDSAYAGPHLLAVADGMGGYEAGEVASASVISTVAPLDRAPIPESGLMDALSAAIMTAKQNLRGIVDADPAVGSMGTTLTAMLWSGAAAAVCHIGDSRAYLLRSGDLYQITRDHTFVQALIDQGKIRPDEAASHPQRSLLLRALDGRGDADPDISMMTAQVGDRYLLCSDGLPVAVSDELILHTLSEVAEPSDTVMRLIELAIQGGGPDNITCIVADVIDADYSQAAPTVAPVVAGAAANGAGNHDTRPFNLPLKNGEKGMTQVAPVQAGAAGAAATNPAARQPARSQPSASHRRAASGEAASASSGRRRWPLMTLILALFLLIVGGGLAIAYQVVQNQYYVGIDGGQVVIFRGVNDRLLGMSLSKVYLSTGIPVSGVPRMDLQAIGRAPGGNLDQANRFVTAIRKDYDSCQSANADLRRWEADKPKPVTKRIRVNGKYVLRTVTPPYRPKPVIPAYCPTQPAQGA